MRDTPASESPVSESPVAKATASQAPVPPAVASEPGLAPDRLRIAAALERARRALIVRPPLPPVEVARAAVFPLLNALGLDVFDLQTLRLQGEAGRERAIYRLRAQEDAVGIEILPAGVRLPRTSSRALDSALWICTSGRFWRAQANGSDPLEFQLFDDGFVQALGALVSGPGGSRLHDAREALRLGELTDRTLPLLPITVEEVERYAAQVGNLRGKLESWFDGQALDLTSRSAFYFVLAALAMQHGREDALPADDLIQPPDEPPVGRRSRPLPRPGWHLLVDHPPRLIEERSAVLLDALRLRDHFTAAQRGEPYPANIYDG